MYVEENRRNLAMASQTDASSCQLAAMETSTTNNGSKQESCRCCSCSRRTWCILAAVALLWYFTFFKTEESDPIASCGDCHCILSEEVLTCPEQPVTEYSPETIALLASQVAMNPYTLNCNPYNDINFPDVVGAPCNTVPPLEQFYNGAVCGLHYETYQDGVCSSEYRLKSYASLEEAQSAGAFVTHHGACGVCSTTQDLAAYLRSPDLTTKGRYCSKQAILSFELALDCYRDLGFTDTCAAIWVYNGLNTAEKCLGTCATSQNEPNNGPPPACTLNECLQCDEDESGPLFQKFAARTRRRSGLLSAIARPCDELVDITQEACPETLALLGE